MKKIGKRGIDFYDFVRARSSCRPTSVRAAETLSRARMSFAVSLRGGRQRRRRFVLGSPVHPENRYAISRVGSTNPRRLRPTRPVCTRSRFHYNVITRVQCAFLLPFRVRNYTNPCAHNASRPRI
jgi:hypothetical protein